MNIKRAAALLLAAICLLTAPAGAAFTMSNVSLTAHETVIQHRVSSVGRYTNWAGVSNVSQFTDERGRFCFAVDGGDHVDIYRTENGQVQGGEVLSIGNPYDSFGGAVCGADGSMYLVWGRNGDTDTSQNTVFVSKYAADGTLIATAEGNGSEGMPYYYPADFNTKLPFSGGNCDVAIQGNVLMVNYAREMYNGHQSNTVFAVNTDNMTVLDGCAYYNSHSFDQRVSPYGSDRFVLASHGDCYDRGFALTMASGTGNGSSPITFHFWVEQGAFDEYDMWKVNKTRARLGNVLETEAGVALIGASARSLSEAADSEPHDVFVQVYDPVTGTFVTEGERTGLGGKNGDESVTDHGVQWLTDLSGGGTVDVVQAVSIEGGRIAVLYELMEQGTYSASYDSTWLIVLNPDGSVFREALKLGDMRLNADEDPVFADGAVQWVSNRGGSGLWIYRLVIETATTGSLGALTWAYLGNTAAVIDGALSEAEPVIAAGYDADGRLLRVETLTRTEQEAVFSENTARVRLFRLGESGAPLCEAATLR